MWCNIKNNNLVKRYNIFQFRFIILYDVNYHLGNAFGVLS